MTSSLWGHTEQLWHCPLDPLPVPVTLSTELLGLGNNHNLAPKTTNCTEGWQNSMRGLFLASHPSMWTLFKGIMKDISIQKLVIINSDTANGDKPKAKYRLLAERLSVKVQLYTDDTDKLKYLRVISYITQIDTLQRYQLRLFDSSMCFIKNKK